MKQSRSSSLLISLLLLFLRRKPVTIPPLKELKRILVVRQHNQLGDMLVGTPLFRTLRQHAPNAEIIVIASKENISALVGNPHISKTVLFDKKNLSSILEVWKILRSGFDLSLVPATVSVTFTGCLLARLAKSSCYLGPASLNGESNAVAEFFDIAVDLDWRNQPPVHTSQKTVDILKPLGLETEDYTSVIHWSAKENALADDFVQYLREQPDQPVIGLHPGAGKVPNRWNAENFIQVIQFFREEYDAALYFTGTGADEEVFHRINSKLDTAVPIFLNKTVAQTAAMVAISDLYITNDTGAMHIAGATGVRQISLFGPTEPLEWAPVGENKHYLKVSESVDSVTPDMVIELSKQLLGRR